MSVETGLEQIVPGLYASPPEPLGFGPNLEIRAYLLEREEGNLLLYRSDALRAEQEAITELGGIARQYLNHSHEAAPVCDWVAATFDAPLFCHEADAEAVSRSCTVGHTFSRRHRIGADFEVIPTPGHTPGATAYLWEAEGHRILFTGDTLIPGPEGWAAALLAGSTEQDRDAYIESLELLRSLEFDLLVSSIARADNSGIAETGPEDSVRRIGEAIDHLRGDESR